MHYRIARGFSTETDSFEAGEEIEPAALVEAIGKTEVRRYVQNGRIVQVGEPDTEPAPKGKPRKGDDLNAPSAGAGPVLPPVVTR